MAATTVDFDELMPASDTDQSWVPPRWWGATAGVTAVLAALGVGQLAAGFDSDAVHPVVSVGDRVIDHVPAPIKRFGIDVFGTSDKTALVIGTVIILFILGAVAGVTALRKNLNVGMGIVAAFGVIGVLAATTGDGPTDPWYPSVVAAAAAAAALWRFHRWSYPTAPAGRPAAGTEADRRRFLMGTVAVSAGAIFAGLIGTGLRSRFDAELQRVGVRLPAPSSQLPPLPVDPAGEIPGLSPFVIPNDRFYRIDTALIPPSITLADWTLTIDGMVDTPVTFTYEELSQRKLIEVDVTISCVSNEVGGRLVGNARWTGVRLDELLGLAGMSPDADQIVGHSVDGWTGGFPTSIIDGRDAILALGMNGEVLPVEHGFPARLIIPGLYGYVSATKWIERIEITRFDQVEGYWIPRGWSASGPIKTQSRIDTPSSGRQLTAGAHPIAGVAWAPTRGIAKVEVQVDDGPWMVASLGPEVSMSTWRQWWVSWDATSGSHTIRVRATDGDGQIQTSDLADVAPNGATGWHTVDVDVV